MSNQKTRIIELQRQLKIARGALNLISAGGRDPERIANDAIYEMMPMDRRQPLQGLVGHERRR